PLAQAWRRLRGCAHVDGVGLGWKESGGVVTTIPALRVYVTRKLPRSALSLTERIPTHIGAWATDVLPALAARPTILDADALPSLASGMLLSNLRGLTGADAVEPGRLGLGTLGFLALDNRVRTRRQLVLVSNQHVLLAHGARLGDALYRPQLQQRGGAWQVRPGPPIAEISDEGCADNHSFAYRHECPADYFV